MSYDMTTTPDNSKRKSFWSKPEGKTGMLLIAAAAVALFVFGGPIGAFILGALQTGLGIICCLLALAAILYVVTNKQIRTGCWYLFKTISRMFTGAIIELNPIAILKTYLRDMRDKKRELDEKRGQVNASMIEVNTKITEKTKEIQRCKDMYEQAKKHNYNDAQIATLSTKVGLLNDMIKNLIPYQQKLTVIVSHLDRMSKASDVIIAQTAVTIEMKEEEYKAITRASSAVKSAMSIFNGDPDKKEMFDDAMAYIADDIALKVGEMTRAIEDSSQLLDHIDLENFADSEAGKKILESFNPDNYTLLSIDEVNDARNKPHQISSYESSQVEEPVLIKSRYK
jgi:hypothetical protein